MRYLILSIKCFFLTETKKKIAILLITILLLVLCISLPIIFVTAAYNKEKFENSYLDRDRTRVFCDKNKKISQAIIDYTTKDDKNNISNDIFKNNNNNNYSIFLWCTNETNLNFDKVYNAVYSLFYLTYKNIMNLKSFSINSIEREIYSKEWNKKYTLDKNNFDGYFIK